MNKQLDSEYFHMISRKARNEHGILRSRMRGPHHTLKYDAWKSVLGLHLGNRVPSGTHIKGRTLRRRTSQRRNRKQKTKLLISLATD